MGDISAKDIEAVLELFERSDWDELHLEMGQFRLDLSKRDCAHRALAAPVLPASDITAPSVARPVIRQPQSMAVQAAPDRVGVAASSRVPDGWVAVRAPNLGTFFRAPKPGAPPYVEIGQNVRAGTEICMLEVMKLFTTVVTEVGGIVREVCVADGEMVEHDQPLVLIEPEG